MKTEKTKVQLLKARVRLRLEDMFEEIEIDLEYNNHASIALDCALDDIMQYIEQK